MKDELNAHLDLSTSEKPQGHKKVILYLKDLTDDQDFLKKVVAIREKFGIPKNGSKGKIFQSTDPTTLYKEIEKLADEYCIRDPFDSYLEDFVIHNDIDSEWEYGYREIVDLKEIISSKWPSILKASLEELGELTKSHPIAILIDPYSSQNEIFDLIRITYKNIIKPLQKKYTNPKIKIGAVRKKSERVKIREKFIFKHPHLSARQLVLLIKEKLGETMEYNYVQKILTKQRQKLNIIR